MSKIKDSIIDVCEMYYNGMSYEAIAQVTCMPVVEVKSIIRSYGWM